VHASPRRRAAGAFVFRGGSRLTRTRPNTHPARRRLRLAAAVLLAAALGATGCAPPAAKPEDAATRAQALIESGNQAFRAQDFRVAARRYAAATEVREDDPAAWYGLGMALAKLGRDEEAREAYTRAKALARTQDSTATDR
jgi:Flp pilus assembly protein TadD